MSLKLKSINLDKFKTIKICEAAKFTHLSKFYFIFNIKLKYVNNRY